MAHGKKTARTLLILFLLADALLVALVFQRYTKVSAVPKEVENLPALNPIHQDAGQAKFLTAAHMTFLPIAFSGSEGHVQIQNNSSLNIDGENRKILYITGEIANYTAQAISHVSINAVLYPSNGTNAVATIHGSPLAAVIAPGQTACFQLAMEMPGKYERYELSIPGFQSGGEPTPTLELADVTAGFDKAKKAYVLSGRALSPDDSAPSGLRVIATLYDRDGTVVGCGQSEALFSPESLSVGGAFSLSFPSRAARTARVYKLDLTAE